MCGLCALFLALLERGRESDIRWTSSIKNLAFRQGCAIRDPEKSAFVTLARVVKTQGRHGEVAVEVHSDVPDRFHVGTKLLALPRDSEDRRELEVEELWPHKEFLILKFSGVDSISEAEKLIGCELQLPASQRAKLEAGWNYVSDLIGCAVFDHDRKLGVIWNVTFGAGEAPLLAVSDGGGNVWEIPFAESYLDQVDVEQQRVLMHLPQGLLELNAPLTEEEKREQARPLRNRR